MTELRVERIGGFRVLDSLHGASGSQGTLYRAVCETPPFPGISPGEIVALKTMSAVDEDGSLFRKLKRRTDSLVTVNHPNVVKYRGCFPVVEAFNSVHVVVMECLEGETLKDRLRVNPEGLDVDEVLNIANGMLAGLAATSAVGIVHRDIKPSNVFLCRDGGVKLIDFEIARQDDGTVTTGSGRFFGTFDYMAPDFADPTFRGDVRSDVFSAAVVLHEMLSGRTPYVTDGQSGGHADFDFMSRWSGSGDSPLRVSARATRLLSGMKEVLLKGLSADRTARFADFDDFAEALSRVRFRELANGANRYRLLRIVGKGGFGEVFKARLSADGRLVAVKHLLKSDYGDRFRRESRIMQRFRDPCFTQFIDYFETGNAGTREAFLVMEYLHGMPGSSLRDAIKRHRKNPLPPHDVLKAFCRYAHGLAVMHRAGVYHRDIKPANLYYPEGNPGGAVIMDMGIVRDTGGTATQGQVPGTLDYMPPEIVTAGGRGDAGMDIYALGLCLYESLTGKMGYERLPAGTAAFGAFYARAQSMTPPSFDDPEILRRPAVLDLLRRMTNPDRRKRLADAAALERQLLSIEWNCVKGAAVLPRATARVERRPSTSASSRRARPPDNDPVTGDTAPTGGRGREDVRPAESRRESMREIVSFSVKAACVAGLLLAGWLAWPFAVRGWDAVSGRVKSFLERRQEAEIEREAERRRIEERRKDEFEKRRLAEERRAAEERERKAAEERRHKHARKIAEETAAAVAAAYAVEGAYLNASDVAEADIARDAWMKKWKGVSLAPGTVAKCAAMLEKARESSVVRIRGERMAAAKRAERRKKMAEDMRRARHEAEEIINGYRDGKLSVASMDSRHAAWRSRWSELSGTAAFKAVDDDVFSVRAERRSRENEKQVMDECRRLIDNVWISTSENVRNWRGYLDRAEIEIKKALGDGRITENGAETIRRELSRVDGWAVGVVDNRSHCDLEFMGRRIPSVEAAPANRVTFVFTNGIPDGAAITSPGYEPIAVRKDRFDKTILRIMPRDLERVVGESSLIVPPLAGDVLCFVDGIPHGSGTASVKAGKHELVYRNVSEAFGGIKRYMEQKIIVETEEGVNVSAPPPSAWVETAEYRTAKADEDTAGRSGRIVDRCMALLAVQPLETRRDRLEKVWKIINDSRISSTLGDAMQRKLRSRYDAERRKVVAVVENDTDRDMTVDSSDGKKEIPPHGSGMVVFENGVPPTAYVRVDGYDAVAVSSLKGFADGTIVFSKENLVPSEVEVSVPEAGPGVEVRISGRTVAETFSLRPGRYVCVYSRAGFHDQRFQVEVKIGEPMELPSPGEWQESGVFGEIMDAVRDVSDSTSRGVKTAVDTVSSIETKGTGR